MHNGLTGSNYIWTIYPSLNQVSVIVFIFINPYSLSSFVYSTLSSP